MVTGAVVVIAAILGVIGYRLAQNAKVNRVLLSEYGKRYIDLMEITGRATLDSTEEGMMKLVQRREELYREADSAGYDLRVLDGYFRSKLVGS